MQIIIIAPNLEGCFANELVNVELGTWLALCGPLHPVSLLPASHMVSFVPRPCFPNHWADGIIPIVKERTTWRGGVSGCDLQT